MTVASESEERIETRETTTQRRLFRSSQDRVIAGIGGGLGRYFGVDPVWFRIAFVLLALGGGSGFLIYAVMWLIIPVEPPGYQPASATTGSATPAAVVGMVFIMVGTIALVNTMAPSLGQYFWPAVFVLGGLALLIGGLSRDNRR